MVKTIAHIIFALLVSTALSACSGGGGGTDDRSQSGNTAQTPAPAPTPTPVTHSVTMNWTPPTQRSDGTTLAIADMAGYTIRYGQSAGNLNQTITINNGLASSHTIGNLSAGTWHFSIQTRDIQGQTSSQTGPQAITLQ